MGALDEIKTMRAELQKKMETEGKALLRQEFTKFFDANPSITELRWTQYTPYFNDGGVCSFSVNNFTFKATDETSKYEDENDGFIDTWGRSKHTAMVKAFDNDVSDDDVFEAVFGDGVRVTATRDGFEVEEYEHD
jgi:hypothetical protein